MPFSSQFDPKNLFIIESMPNNDPIDLNQRIVRLRIANGRHIETFASVLLMERDSLFAEIIEHPYFTLAGDGSMAIDCGHRDAALVRLVVEALRARARAGGRHTSSGNNDDNRHSYKHIVLPDAFGDRRQLVAEARYWRLPRFSRG